MTTSPAIAAVDLRKRYGQRTAVDGLSFTVMPGEAYGLVGPNGAGKTTTIRVVCGLLTPDGGEVRIGGAAPTDPEARATLGYVPQEIALLPELAVQDNARFWARMQRVPRSERRARVDEVLELVGLADRRRDAVATCSGGMQRRLNIAVALLHRPAVLVLDEPTVGVDPQSRHRLLDLIAALRDRGVAVLYTSHYLEEVERVCDRVGIVDGGRVVAEGTPAEVAGDGARLEERFLALTGTALRD